MWSVGWTHVKIVSAKLQSTLVMWSTIVVSNKMDRDFISKQNHLTTIVSLTCQLSRYCTSRELRDLFYTSEAEFLLAIQSHLYSFALRFLFLQTHATSYSFFCALLYILYTVKEKGEKPYPLSFGLRNP
jgi:hypothetical protein